MRVTEALDDDIRCDVIADRSIARSKRCKADQRADKNFGFTRRIANKTNQLPKLMNENPATEPDDFMHVELC